MDKKRLDQLVADISAPLFIYRMSKPVAEPGDEPEVGAYDERLTKGAKTKLDNARTEIHEILMDYVRDVERGKANG